MTAAEPDGPGRSPARFISFEGGEGAGKSTQVGLLQARLQASGIACLATREPGGSSAAEEIRRLLVEGAVDRWDPLTEALLHFAARREHVETTVRPALAEGRWVITDRFADSTMAYQGYGHGLGRAPIEALCRLVLGDFAPDLSLILDLDPASGLARASNRQTVQSAAEDRYERMDRAFHQRLRDGFLDIARRDPQRCAVIDAAQPEDAVHRAVCGAIADRLKVRLLSDGD
ncbi:MAG: dTMP kinase [Alphaproteobacteria bacterium]|nr:dTMP kinase [Alphaproteobacteria bacterium]